MDELQAQIDEQVALEEQQLEIWLGLRDEEIEENDDDLLCLL